MLYTVLTCKFLPVISWEMGFETKLDCEILQDCTKAFLWEKKDDFYFSLWTARKHNSLLSQFLLWYSNFFLVDILEEPPDTHISESLFSGFHTASNEAVRANSTSIFSPINASLKQLREPERIE